ncbi:MAG TPA: hypothetical protein VGX03_24675 [Candidatus Binatia bacterium]|jgi:hypothetical protein|nr:hypothetical protein [Candidatus Binatia bacterium]
MARSWERTRGDEGFLLEAVEVLQSQPRYGRVLGSGLTNEACDARERGEGVDRKGPDARPDCWRT